jgi:hypothetical protein
MLLKDHWLEWLVYLVLSLSCVVVGGASVNFVQDFGLFLVVLLSLLLLWGHDGRLDEILIAEVVYWGLIWGLTSILYDHVVYLALVIYPLSDPSIASSESCRPRHLELVRGLATDQLLLVELHEIVVQLVWIFEIFFKLLYFYVFLQLVVFKLHQALVLNNRNSVSCVTEILVSLVRTCF